MGEVKEPASVNDALVALVRTVVPVVVGALLAWGAQLGLGFTPGTSALLEVLLTAVFTAAYYAGVRALSARWAWFGWLLGYPVDPTYSPRHAGD